MPAPGPRRSAALMWAFVTSTALVCAALLSAAVLVPAPPGAVAVVAVVCIGCPMLAVWGAAAGIATSEPRSEAPSVAELRRELDRLPETQHPLGL